VSREASSLRGLIALLLCSASTGCAYLLAAGGAQMVEAQQQQELETRTRNGLEERIRPWVGKPVADVIAAWGEPYQIDRETREYVWREQQRSDSLVTSAAVTVDVVLTTDERGTVTGGSGRVTDSR
jgi:hypothetical protein